MVTRIMQEMQEMVGKQDRSIWHTWGHYQNTGIASTCSLTDPAV